MADKRLRELERVSRAGNDADKAAWVTHLLRNSDAECVACAGQGYAEEHGTATFFGGMRGPNGESQVPCVARSPCRNCGTTGLRLRGWLELAAWCWAPWAAAAIRTLPSPTYGRKQPMDIDGKGKRFREWADEFFRWSLRVSALAMAVTAGAALRRYRCPHRVENPPVRHYCGQFLRAVIRAAEQWAETPTDESFHAWVSLRSQMPSPPIDWLPWPSWLPAQRQRELGVWLPRGDGPIPTVGQRLFAGAVLIGYDEAHTLLCNKLAEFAETQLRRG